MEGYVNEILPIKLQLDDGVNGLYPRVRILRSVDNVLLDDLALGPANGDGLYGVNYTPTAIGHLTLQYKVYTSNLYNTLADYTIPADEVLITDPSNDQENIAQDVWTYANRTLTEPVDVDGLDPSSLATTQDVINAKNDIIAALDVWEAKGSVSMNRLTDTLELIAWLTKNGETILDADSAAVQIRDSDDQLVADIGTDSMISSTAGLFKFNRGGASAIILKSKTYVMKIVITRGSETYRGNVSISTY